MMVENDAEICHLLKEYLGQEALVVSPERDLRSADDTLTKQVLDLLQLDISKSTLNALDTLKALRVSINIAVTLIESGMLTVKEQKHYPTAAVKDKKKDNVVELHQLTNKLEILDNLTIIRASRQVMLGKEYLNLTSNEFNLLLLLIDKAGSIVSKELLSHKGIGKQFQLHQRSVDMHISNLRKKLGPDSLGRERIKTVRGIGYQLVIYPDT